MDFHLFTILRLPGERVPREGLFTLPARRLGTVARCVAGDTEG